MQRKFELLMGEQKVGTLSFNGGFLFTLESNIDLDKWQHFGIIPVDNTSRTQESGDLFLYINSRLPITLRDAKKEEKIKYIEETGLRVASDDFYFKKIS